MAPRKSTKKVEEALAISPSIFERVFNCPASARLCAGVVVEENAAMRRGTEKHEHLVKCFEGKAEPRDSGEYYALNQLLEIRSGLVALNHGEPVIQHIEDQLDFKWLGITLGENRGRADYAFVALRDGCAAVIDYKTGKGGESYDRPTESWQLRLYAIALVEMYPELVGVWVMYLAPEREGAVKCSGGFLGREELLECKELAIEAVKAAKAKDAPAVSGDHCRWCPAKSKCPAMAKALPSVGNDTLVGVSVVDKFAALAPTGRAELWQKVLAAEEWLASVKADIIKLAANGHKVDGYEAVPYRIDLRWKDEAEAEKALYTIFLDEAYERKLLSPAAAKKKAGDSTAFAHLVTEVPSAISLKRRK